MTRPKSFRPKPIWRPILEDARAIRALVRDPEKSRSYYPECARKSKRAILADLLSWWVRYGEVNKYYYLYGLDRVDADTDSVMPYRHFRAMRNSRNLHPSDLSPYYGDSYNYVCLMRDKFMFSQFASSLGMPAAKVLAICSPDTVRWPDSGECTALDDLPTVPGLRIDGICKPADGIMGANIFLLEVDSGRLFIDGSEASVDDLRSRLTPRHLLQARIVQHPEMSRLHARSVNTLRLVTFNQNGTVVLFSAGLRIGAGGAPTDNWSAGGILVAVDPELGVARGTGCMKPNFGRRVSRHPDTGVEFDGFAIPDFNRAVAMAQQFHAYLPGIHSIGWDIAITEDGPVFVEGNDDWDGAVSMVLDPGFKQKFVAMYRRPAPDRREPQKPDAPAALPARSGGRAGARRGRSVIPDDGCGADRPTDRQFAP